VTLSIAARYVGACTYRQTTAVEWHMITRVPNPGDPEIDDDLIRVTRTRQEALHARQKALNVRINDEKSGLSKRPMPTPYSIHGKIFAVFPVLLAFFIWLLNIVVIAMLGYSLLQNAVTAALIYTSCSIGFILLFYSILLSRAEARARWAEERRAAEARASATEEALTAAARARAAEVLVRAQEVAVSEEP